MNPLLKTPSSDFAAIRDGRNSLPLYIDVDLSTARDITANTQLVLNIAGNSFYSDANTTSGGNAVVHFQDTNLGISSAPFFVSPGFIANVGFTQLLIENTAQAGKRIRIFYGVDIAFQAGVNSSITISGTVNVGNALNIFPTTALSSFADGTLLAANTPLQVFAPAANTGGAIITSGNIIVANGAGPQYSVLIAKNAAPANITDGQVIFATSQSMGAAYVVGGQLNKDIYVAAGKGLYFISNAAEATASHHSCNYKLL